MDGFGMIELEGGVRSYAHDEMYGLWALNPLLVRRIWSVTGAPFARPQVQPIHNDDYALVEVAAVFASVLHAPGGIQVVSNSADPNAPTIEHTTAVTTYPKYEIVLGGGRTVLAGVIASIIGDDPAYGPDPTTKGGKLAEALGEKYDPTAHPQLMADLIAAASPWKAA